MRCELCGGSPDKFYWRESVRGWRTIEFCDDCTCDVPEHALPDYLENRVMVGTPHKLALMFACQTPPMSNTDREFLQDTHETGKKYISQIARFPNDPRAWVTGKSDLQRICEQENWGCEGLLNVKATDMGYKPPDRIGLDPVLLEEYTQRAINNDPGLAEKPREEVREKVRNRIQPHWAKK